MSDYCPICRTYTGGGCPHSEEDEEVKRPDTRMFKVNSWKDLTPKHWDLIIQIYKNCKTDSRYNKMKHELKFGLKMPVDVWRQKVRVPVGTWSQPIQLQLRFD
tara:strand:+ start:105 stop:413 length:309 start_codon:yes stop_codon:yes gene_type:complete